MRLHNSRVSHRKIPTPFKGSGAHLSPACSLRDEHGQITRQHGARIGHRPGQDTGPDRTRYIPDTARPESTTPAIPTEYNAETRTGRCRTTRADTVKLYLGTIYSKIRQRIFFTTGTSSSPVPVLLYRHKQLARQSSTSGGIGPVRTTRGRYWCLRAARLIPCHRPGHRQMALTIAGDNNN